MHAKVTPSPRLGFETSQVTLARYAKSAFQAVSKDKMGIGNTDVTRDILSRKLFLETGDKSLAS